MTMNDDSVESNERCISSIAKSVYGKKRRVRRNRKLRRTLLGGSYISIDIACEFLGCHDIAVDVLEDLLDFRDFIFGVLCDLQGSHCCH